MTAPPWRSRRLGDFARIKHGYAFSGMTADVPAPFPVVVGIGNFDYAGGFRFGSTTLKRFKGEYPPEYALSSGDVLLAMTCQTPGGEILGIPGRVPDDGTVYLHNQRLGKVEILDTDELDLGFVFQLARWTEFNRHLFVTASGSKILHTSPGRIEDFELQLPSVEEQRAIATTLGSLDAKIESNRQLIELIPSLIRAVVVNELDPKIAPIPVSDLAAFVNGGAFTKGASGAGRMVLRIAELNGGPSSSTVYNDIEVPDDKTARPGDILMSWSGSLSVYRWARDEAIINQHIFKVIPSNLPPWLVFDRLDAVIDIFRRIAADKATTMGHIQRGDLDSTLVPLPSSDSIRRLDNALGPMWARLLVAEAESLDLVSLRGVLLPELLSGRTRVPVLENS